MIKGKKTVILAVGNMVYSAAEAIKLLKGKIPFLPALVNARFIKPLDKQLLKEIFEKYDFVVTVEESCLQGGFGSAVGEFYNSENFKNTKIFNIGIPDNFINHGRHDILLKELGLDPEGIANRIIQLWQK